MKKTALVLLAVISSFAVVGQDLSDLYSSLKETVVIIQTSENVSVGKIRPNLSVIGSGDRLALEFFRGGKVIYLSMTIGI